MGSRLAVDDLPGSRLVNAEMMRQLHAVYGEWLLKDGCWNFVVDHFKGARMLFLSKDGSIPDRIAQRKRCTPKYIGRLFIDRVGIIDGLNPQHIKDAMKNMFGMTLDYTTSYRALLYAQEMVISLILVVVFVFFVSICERNPKSGGSQRLYSDYYDQDGETRRLSDRRRDAGLGN
ncbi:hypothetical protein F2Q70_00034839 [Brassica cretica]|uniref:Uncharacterized protein n=1 Tax=Brassica cretica TaxID=69181 RepID=A0A8S9JP44_BRACR|nr:hypothetical protein F2Q70_00034839 [Brassica cretica]